MRCCHPINGKLRNFANNSVYNGIPLCISINNLKARALYEKSGYKIDDQFVYYFLEPDKKWDMKIYDLAG